MQVQRCTIFYLYNLSITCVVTPSDPQLRSLQFHNLAIASPTLVFDGTAPMIHTETGVDPILCAPLLRKVDAKLIELLRSLTPAEWDLPTIAGAWRVRDIAAHLLDTPLRKLSLVRDGCSVEPVAIRSAQDLADFVNRLNREGVAVYRRLSPPLLIDLMQLACSASAGFHESLDPFAQAIFSVSWAGEDTSLNWFDTARELTERWHHQQQIRLATNRPGIQTPEFYHPVLDCFVRALPHHYRHAAVPPATTLMLKIDGPCGGIWLLEREAHRWSFVREAPSAPTATVVIPEEIAWRVFTKGIDRASALAQTSIEGDRALGERLLNLTAIVG